MLTNSLGSTLLGQCLYPPVRGGVGQAAPFKDLRPPGPSGGRALCALSFQRHQDASPAPAVVSRASPRRPLPPLLSSMGRSGYSRAQSAGTSTVSAPRPSSLAFSPSALRRVRRLMQHSCGSAQSRTPPVLTSSPGSVRACSSKVRLRRASIWPLFLHTSAGENPAGSVPGAQEAAVPAAGADSVSHPVTGSRLTPSTQRRAARHRLRGNPASATLPCAFIRKAVPVSVEGCAPLDRFPALTPLGRPGPGRGGRLPPAASVSSAVPGSPRFPFHGASEPAAPTLPDRLPGHAPLRSAPLVTDGLTGGHRIQVRGDTGDFSRIDSAACETVSNQGQPGAHARTPVRHRPASHARRPEKRYIHLPKEAAADAAAGAFRLA